MATRSSGAGLPRWVPIAVVGAVVAVALVVVVARRGADGPEVVVVGDSVSVLASEAIGDEVDGPVELVAEAGALTGEMADDLERLVVERADDDDPLERVGVLIGHNDLRADDPDLASLDRMIELTTRFRCAVWFTIPDSETFPGELAVDEIRAWNDAVRERVERHDTLHLETRWQEAVTAAGGEELLAEDRLHPSEQGVEELARIYGLAFAERCASEASR